MIESVNIQNIHINGNSFNNNDEILVNNNYRLKFPFEIKNVDRFVNERLLRDFTGNFFHLLF